MTKYYVGICNLNIYNMKNKTNNYSPYFNCSKNKSEHCKSEVIDMDYFSCFKEKQQVDFEELKRFINNLSSYKDLRALTLEETNLLLFFESFKREAFIKIAYKNLNS